MRLYYWNIFCSYLNYFGDYVPGSFHLDKSDFTKSDTSLDFNDALKPNENRKST